MSAASQKLLIISRDCLLDAEELPSSGQVFRLLSYFSRSGIHVLLTAPEPDHWVPTRGNVDDALHSQVKLLRKIHDVGGDLEGVYYVPRSLFTQDRNREGALRDILHRYSMKSRQTALVSSSVPFLKAASRLGIRTHEILASGTGENNLLSELEKIRKDSFK